MLEEALPRTAAVIEKGIEDGTHLGVQLYVSLDGKPVVDGAVGEAAAGVPMTSDSLMIWFSSTKATVAVSTAQLWERGRLDIEAPVVTYVPEFATLGKESITLRHLLTHTAGIRFADWGVRGRGMAGTWDERTAAICGAPIEDGWVPGRKAGYHPTSGMHMLAECIRRVDGRPYDQYVREEVFEPIGMHDSWVGMTPERHEAYGDRMGTMHNTEAAPKPLPNTGAAHNAATCIPGGGGKGPMHDLGKLYETLLAKGTSPTTGARILSPQSVEAITTRHRVGMHDETFGIVNDWGLGFAIDGINYGRHCSPRTYGHGGAQSSHGMSDPECGLVVAVVCNGMPGPARHYQRMSTLSSAIYEDLGLVEAGDPGRDKRAPAGGLV